MVGTYEKPVLVLVSVFGHVHLKDSKHRNIMIIKINRPNMEAALRCFTLRGSGTDLVPSFATRRRFDGETSNTTFAVRSTCASWFVDDENA
jgi:hypothetical protein